MNEHWEVVCDTLQSFQSLIRLRTPEWTLHSWCLFEETRGGGRIGEYKQQMVCSVWLKPGKP